MHVVKTEEVLGQVPLTAENLRHIQMYHCIGLMCRRPSGMSSLIEIKKPTSL